MTYQLAGLEHFVDTERSQWMKLDDLGDPLSFPVSAIMRSTFLVFSNSLDHLNG